MKQEPAIWQLQTLLNGATEVMTEIDHQWVPKRPEGGAGWKTRIKQRFKAAWLVFTGQADAVIWPHKQ